MADKKKSRKKPRPGKLPKQIAGIKIPKELRKSGEALIATAASPVGRELLRAGVAAVMAGAASRMQTARTPAPGGSTEPLPAPPPPTTADTAAPAFDPEAAGAQIARQVIDLIGNVAGKIIAPPSEPPSRH